MSGKHNIIMDIEDIARREPDMSYITEKGDTFERVLPAEAVKDGFIFPTNGYHDYGGLVGKTSQLLGFYCGDPSEWVPVLIKDGYIDSELDEIRVCELSFEKSLCFHQDRTPCGEEGYTRATIEEQFIVYDKPIKPIAIRKLTKSEIWIIKETLNEIYPT